MLVNLIGNAIKFTETGGVTVATTVDLATRRISFGVKDTGIGMTESQLHRVFQPFEQADSSTTRRSGERDWVSRLLRALLECSVAT